jgi:hypothetical protein
MFLCVDAWHFLDPTNPPIAFLLYDGSTVHAFKHAVLNKCACRRRCCRLDGKARRRSISEAICDRGATQQASRQPPRTAGGRAAQVARVPDGSGWLDDVRRLS